MYSKNDYRYYLEHQLLISNDYLAHYGVMGMKWGVRHDERRASLISKKDANNAKISKYQKKLNTVGAKKRDARAAKYKLTQAKLDKKAARAKSRLARGKKLSRGQVRKLERAERFRARAAKNSRYNDKLRMKVSKLEAKNTKIDKKIARMDKPSRAGARAYQRELNSLSKKNAKLNVQAFSSNKQKASKANAKINDTVKKINDTYNDAQNRGYNISSQTINYHTGSYVIPTMQSGYYSGKKYSVKTRKR